MAKPTARQFHQQMVHYMRKTVNFNDTNIATGVYMGTLPSGAQVIDAVANVTTAFNAGTTNVLTAGQNAGYTDILASGDIAEGSTGGNRGAIATTGALHVTSDADVYVKYAQTGTAATTGAAIIVVTYVVDNDG